MQLASNHQWDLFISHASDDKDDIVRPLASKLRRLGLRVWIDEAELRLGDSLSRKIDEGLALSTAGVVILSPSFFSKNWPEYELRGLTAKVMGGGGRIIPVRHRVSHSDVLRFSPPLADLLAGDTQGSMDLLALKIVAAARPDLHEAVMRKVAYAKQVANAKEGEFPLSQIRQGPIRHSTLPPELVNRIDLIRYALLRAWNQSRIEWLEGFQRDAHPSREIQVWEGIASRLTRATLDHHLDGTGEAAVLRALLAASIGDNDGAARTLVREFGDRAAAIMESMRYNIQDFVSPTAEDKRLQQEMNVDLEAMVGPEANIDIGYIEELVARALEEDIDIVRSG
jgi:hypothetical protein